MQKVWWRFYRWPNDKTLYGTTFYNRLGNAYLLYKSDGTVYIRLPFTELWFRDK